MSITKKTLVFFSLMIMAIFFTTIAYFVSKTLDIYLNIKVDNVQLLIIAGVIYFIYLTTLFRELRYILKHYIVLPVIVISQELIYFTISFVITTLTISVLKISNINIWDLQLPITFVIYIIVRSLYKH